MKKKNLHELLRELFELLRKKYGNNQPYQIKRQSGAVYDAATLSFEKNPELDSVTLILFSPGHNLLNLSVTTSPPQDNEVFDLGAVFLETVSLVSSNKLH